MKRLRVVILKPGKYGKNGFVERFSRGFMPNGTLPYLRSMTPAEFNGCAIETRVIDEYVQTDLSYLDELQKTETPTLLALAGVQTHQFQRSLDLAAYALDHGVEHCVIGGPHPMTCDTSLLHGRGVSFSLSEAETVWMTILSDAIAGELQPVYGQGQRWQRELEAPVLIPPTKQNLARYIAPMMAVYPARGCPFTCNFCSVIKIAGRAIRSQPIETTLASLRAARAAGVKMIIFTSDNFNKYPDVKALLEAMIEEGLNLPFFAQCDAQVARQEELIELLSRAGCFQIFVGVESFNRKTLLGAHKAQNYPQLYADIVRLTRKHRVISHFSNIIGFPEDTEGGIKEHLQALMELSPDLASFYILTPVPGTEQYDDFLANGSIYEKNLDRFDGTCPTWHHPTLGPDELNRNLFGCYARFYSIPRVARRGLGLMWAKPSLGLMGTLHGVGMHLFSRYSALMKMHPMSGGIRRVLRDRTEDYRHLRRQRFGVDLLPLPASLQLSREEVAMNNRVMVS